MSTDRTDVPFLQRAYDSVWWLAVVAFVFFVVAYVVWGLADIFSVPLG